MTHLPYIIACYTLGLGIPMLLAAVAWQRLTAARRRLAALETRPSSTRPSGYPPSGYP